MRLYALLRASRSTFSELGVPQLHLGLYEKCTAPLRKSQIPQEAIAKGWDQTPKVFIWGSDCVRENKEGARDSESLQATVQV